jgi:signal transduction histidine kinase/ligand-binding sensor domain-containing protein
MIQTRDDYLWLGTDNGLVRYDGTHFKLFNRANSGQLPFNEIRTLYEDTDGSIWIGTTRGVARYKLGHPARLENVPQLSSRSAYAFLRDRHGMLWIGTDAETYVGTSESGFQALTNAPRDVRAICEDHNGTLWFGANEGLFCREGLTYRQVIHDRLPKDAPVDESVPTRRVNAIHCDENGDLWIATNRTLLHLRNGQFTMRGQELSTQQIYQVARSRNGALYVAARFGVYRSVAEQPFEEVLSEPSAFCLLEDRQGTLWIGHGDNRGLHSYRNSHRATVWDDSQVLCIHAGTEADIWLGTKTGLCRVRDDVIERFGTEQGLPDPNVTTIAQGGDKRLWIGTAKGFARWSGDAIVAAELPPAVQKMNIGVALEDSTGTLWFALGTDGGFLYSDGQLHELESLRSGRIHWFWEDAKGAVLIGHESGLFRYCGGQLHRMGETELSALQNPRFLCHVTTADGTLWMGTSNGIARYRAGRFDAFAPECGIDADNIERLAADRDGNLWFGGRDGLFHARILELDAVADGRIRRVTSDRIDGFDRFPPVRTFSQACLATDGELWLLQGGLVRLRTKPFLRDPPIPSVHVGEIAVEGTSVSFGEHFQYPSGRRRVSIQFAAQPFTSSRHVEVRYRLDPYDQAWNMSGVENAAHYTDLRPGAYVFRLAARHSNGPWREAERSPAFTVTPRWWETTLFRCLVAFVFVGIGLSYGCFRTHRILRTNEILRREIESRKLAEEDARRHLDQLARVSRAASMGELATSIAHEVKQPVFAILTDAETATEMLDNKNPDLDQVQSALRVITAGGRRVTEIVDRIRSLVRMDEKPPRWVDANELVKSVVGFLEADLRQRNIILSLQLTATLPSILGNEIQLQQVILNLIINGAQAMDQTDVASRVMSVTTRRQHDSVELTVCDCGAGMDASTIERIFEPFFTTKNGGIGMGLTISRTIIRTHGGEIWATPNADRGATFHVRLPIDGTSLGCL